MPSLGRSLIAFAGFTNTITPFLADFNHTHIYNPNWTPHAKFHNGQTMSMAVTLGLSTAYYALKGSKNSSDNLWIAGWLGSMYWVTCISAILYPDSLAIDPEFGSGFPQLYVAFLHLSFVWGGVWLEKNKGKGDKEQ
ncbi:hypothetical protein V8C35DRAFT_286066 [Trichoderma chlorosporum]